MHDKVPAIQLSPVNLVEEGAASWEKVCSGRKGTSDKTAPEAVKKKGRGAEMGRPSGRNFGLRIQRKRDGCPSEKTASKAVQKAT
jgi:hypothetical protein